VTIHVSSSADIEGLEVLWDGKPIGKSEWGSEFPVDGGDHTLSASALGHETWTTSVGIGNEADRRTVEIPQLVAAKSADGSTVDGSKSNSTTAWIAVGVGGALLLGAGGSFILAKSAQNDRKDFCAAQFTPTCPDDDSKSRIHRWETIGFVATGLGVAAVGIGVVLLSNRSSSTTTMQLGAGSVGGSPGIQLGGAF
jgi:hypothetical protein